MTSKRVSILTLPLLFLAFMFMVPECSAEIFAIEYSNCIKKCAPKEKCCTETCGYKACIKQNTTRETATGAELVDPGAGDSAMAVCYPHIDAMKKCFDRTKGAGDLEALRSEYCALAAAKTKKFASKEDCVSQMTASEKQGGLSVADIMKVYDVAITVFKKN